MPGTQRRPASRLIEQLKETPHRFDFFQAVRLLRLYFRDSAGLESAQTDTRIRFASSLSLNFPPSEIESLKFEETVPAGGSEPAEQVRITASFIGLTGNQGALPRYYTERLAERESLHRDRAARAFLELFSHRATALFYQAWLKYRLHFQYEENRRERFLPMLLSLIGLGSNSLRDRLNADGTGVLDESLACFAGVLRAAGKSSAMIQGLLSEYFRSPVRVTQFIGRWFEVPADQLTVLGGRHAALGAGALCGQRVWQRENRVRIEFGPLDRAAFDELLPQGAAAASLARLLGMMTGSQLEYEIRLILRREAVRPAALSEAAPLRLGWDSWVLGSPADQDRSDSGYEIQPHLHHGQARA